jgi:hypothetical protein
MRRGIFLDHFNTVTQERHAEDLPAAEIAREVGTRCDFYFRAALERHWHGEQLLP